MQSTGLKIIAFDPGGTTGWAGHRVRPRDHPMSEWAGGQFSPDDDVHPVVNPAAEHCGHHKHLFEWLHKMKPNVVVCERFVYEIRRNQGVDMPGVVLISRDYIGVIELYCKMTLTPLFMRTRNALHLWDDEKLKKLGLYTAGARHRNDATRHLLDYIVGELGRRDYLKPLRSIVQE